jgi:hypothetical protein
VRRSARCFLAKDKAAVAVVLVRSNEKRSDNITSCYLIFPSLGLDNVVDVAVGVGGSVASDSLRPTQLQEKKKKQ